MMTVMFLCGSLAPGKDGVGDYTRRLASELVRQGQRVGIVALNDRHVSAVVREPGPDREHDLGTLRIPSTVSRAERLSIAREFIRSSAPDWLSLQYVPYSFNVRGLPLNLSRELRAMAGSSRWHVMFHELWGGVGTRGGRSTKTAVTFRLQQAIIRGMMSSLRPAAVTTSNAAYASALRGADVQVLPLFGNIPIAQTDESLASDRVMRAIHFGTFSGDLAGFNEQIDWLLRVARAKNLTLRLTSIGNGGPHQDAAMDIARKALGADKALELGRLPEPEVSAALQGADIGVSRADGVLWGKSGTTVALLEHGLPVLLRGSRESLSSTYSESVFADRLCFTDDASTSIPSKTAQFSTVPAVAKRFLTLLGERPTRSSSEESR